VLSPTTVRGTMLLLKGCLLKGCHALESWVAVEEEFHLKLIPSVKLRGSPMPAYELR
jgi:hypothetical protein